MSDKIMDRIDLPDGEGSILLYDYMLEEVKDGRNLIRVDASGRIVWKASLPPVSANADCFVAVDLRGGKLTANTHSCYLVAVDIENGHSTVLTFTK
jgi:outer membrane protein assembly factor BamB